MPGTSTANLAVHITNLFGLIGFVVLWLGLVACLKLLCKAFRNDPLIGWAIGPFGVSALFLSTPSAAFILFTTILQTLVSGTILYLGLFSGLPTPLVLPHNFPVILIVLVLGMMLTSLGDWIAALRDLYFPLWGEARILRNIQSLRASWASIHFTPFGRSYLREHFGSNPTELLQAL
ncbi:MAG TPA: hypothetical protein VHD63_21570 [Ktedonobacteraceae bacterium]|nr:hypothetical protein [Ktedonobacteraceae bacterium]